MKCLFIELLFSPLKSVLRTFVFFLISWIVSWCNRSVSSTAVLPREIKFVQRMGQNYLLCMDFTQGLRICQEEGQWSPPLHHPSQNLSHRTLDDSALDKTLISHEQDQLTILKYWLMKRLSLSLRALLEPYPDWWYQNNTDFKHFKFIAYITPS